MKYDIVGRGELAEQLAGYPKGQHIVLHGNLMCHALRSGVLITIDVTEIGD